MRMFSTSEKWLGLVSVVAVAAVALAASAGARVAQPQATSCKPGLHGRVVYFCGPATARLSRFLGVEFKSGSCRTKNVNGTPQFTVQLGVRTQNARTNDGRPYFGLTVSGRLSNPTGGGVIAYWKGKRWGGFGERFKGNANAGSFVAHGINGSPGRATGSFQCNR